MKFENLIQAAGYWMKYPDDEPVANGDNDNYLVRLKSGYYTTLSGRSYIQQKKYWDEMVVQFAIIIIH